MGLPLQKDYVNEKKCSATSASIPVLHNGVHNSITIHGCAFIDLLMYVGVWRAWYYKPEYISSFLCKQTSRVDLTRFI